MNIPTAAAIIFIALAAIGLVSFFTITIPTLWHAIRLRHHDTASAEKALADAKRMVELAEKHLTDPKRYGYFFLMVLDVGDKYQYVRAATYGSGIRDLLLKNVLPENLQLLEKHRKED